MEAQEKGWRHNMEHLMGYWYHDLFFSWFEHIYFSFPKEHPELKKEKDIEDMVVFPLTFLTNQVLSIRQNINTKTLRKELWSHGTNKKVFKSN